MTEDRFLESWQSGYMKTTLEIPDELYRSVKAKAAIEGKRVTDLVIEGMRLAIEKPLKSYFRAEFPILKSKEPGRLTSKTVKKALESIGDEEAKKVAKLMRP